MAALDAMPPEHRERIKAAGAAHDMTALQEGLERLVEAIEKDVESDRQLVQAIGELVQALKALVPHA